MSAAAALRLALEHGVRVEVEGDDLLLEAEREPPADVLHHLVQQKAQLLSLLRPGPDWDAEDWRNFFDERAGIREFDGGLDRQAAEAAAFTDTLEEWLLRHPSDAPHDRRQAAAVTALAKIGIAGPTESSNDFGKNGEA
ncbi:MAG: hypothetical protein RIC87_08155 [Kiloniellales bacterium]